MEALGTVNGVAWLRRLGPLMKASGKRCVLTFVDYGNWVSLRRHLRFGLQPTESVLTFKVMGVKLFRTVQAVGPAASSVAGYLAVTHHALAL